MLHGRKMELIGTISYVTLEEGVKSEWDALFVYEVGRSVYFRNNCQLPPEIKKGLPNLASCMQNAMSHLYLAYSPLFKKEYFDLLATEIACQRTFFERSDAFLEMHGCEDNMGGIFYEEEHSCFPNKPGSHIRIYQPSNPGLGLEKLAGSEVRLTIFHEYGHEMHYQACKADISCFEYGEYDSWISEVLANHAERRIEKDQHADIYRKYVNLIKRLEKLPEFAVMPFYRQWEKILGFSNRRELVKHLRQNGV